MASIELNSTDFPLIAQAVTCYYPISDVWAPTPRYLYYALLFCSFITPRHTWLSHIFFGGAITYAATAAFEAFILLSAQLVPAPSQNVTIPFLQSANLTSALSDIPGLTTDTNYVSIQPDYLELDIDAITAVVVTAYLVGLPLQTWSSTARTSRILHLLLFIWNIVMLAGSISVLVLWPTLNRAATQYRFCYGALNDGDLVQNSEWDTEFWSGSWNSTVWNLFGATLFDQQRWLDYDTDCLYPCFSTHQILRESNSLTAAVLGPVTRGAPEYSWSVVQSDAFQPLIYSAISLFTAAQIYLLVVGRLRLCTDRVPIYRPLQLWVKRKEITRSFLVDIKTCWARLKAITRRKQSNSRTGQASPDTPNPTAGQARKHTTIYFFMDLLTLAVLLNVMISAPLIIIAFIVWIETYIRSDGKPRENFENVGQWTFIVQIGILLLAVLIIRLRHKIASEDEIQRDIEVARGHVAHLELIAERKRTRRQASAEKRRHGGHESLARRIGLPRWKARSDKEKREEVCVSASALEDRPPVPQAV